MTHAGIHPDWSIEGTVQRGELLSDAIVRQNWDWYRNEKTPIGYVAQILTRMRTLEPDGTPEIEFTGGLDEISNQSKPWFQFPCVVGKHFSVPKTQVRWTFQRGSHGRGNDDLQGFRGESAT